MNRKAIIALVFGIVLTVAPAANAVVLSDGGGTSNSYQSSVVVHPDVLGGNGMAASVAIHPDVLGGNGTPAISIHSDVLGGNGSSAAVAIRPDVLGGSGGSQVREVPILTAPDNTFAWSDVAYGAAIALAAMLLAATAVYTTRRRSHRLSF